MYFIRGIGSIAFKRGNYNLSGTSQTILYIDPASMTMDVWRRDSCYGDSSCAMTRRLIGGDVAMMPQPSRVAFSLHALTPSNLKFRFEFGCFLVKGVLGKWLGIWFGIQQCCNSRTRSRSSYIDGLVVAISVISDDVNRAFFPSPWKS